MQSKKWLAAMAVGLGVLAGAAQAVPMKMTIDGHLTTNGNFDKGQESFWGYATSSQAQMTGDLPIQITIRFNSDSLASSYQGTGPAFSADITLNGTQRSITSNSSWLLSAGRNKDITLKIEEADVKGNDGKTHGNYLSGTLSFADDSLSTLNNMRLGHATAKLDLLKTNSLYFNYVTGNPSNWQTNTELKIVPTSASIAPVPEPETWAMMVAGLGLVGFAARRRSR